MVSVGAAKFLLFCIFLGSKRTLTSSYRLVLLLPPSPPRSRRLFSHRLRALLAVPTTHVFLSCDPFWPVLPPYDFSGARPSSECPPSLSLLSRPASSAQRLPLLLPPAGISPVVHTASSAPVLPPAAEGGHIRMELRVGGECGNAISVG